MNRPAFGLRNSKLLLACALLAGSGWLPIPLPERVFQAALPASFEGTLGGLSFQWATCTIHATDLNLKGGDGSSVALEQLSIQLHPFPGEHFLKPRKVLVDGGAMHIHSEATLEQLLQPQSNSQNLKRPQNIQVAIHSISLTHSFFPEQSAFELVQATGKVFGDQLRIYGELRTPFGPTAKAWLHHTPSEWSLDFAVPESPLDSEDAFPMHLAADSCEASGHFSRDQKILSLQLHKLDVAVQDLVSCTFEQLSLEGDLAKAWAFSGEGELEDTPLHAEGWLQPDARGDLTGRIEALIPALVLDEERIERLQKLSPSTAEVLHALELRGACPISLSLDWNAKQGFHPPLAHAPFEGISLAYRGLLEEDGDRPSFPYPVEHIGGDFVALGSKLFLDVGGLMGPSPARLNGSIEVRDGPANLGLEVDIPSLPVDANIRHALVGIPEAAQVWRDLGGPKGGFAHVNLGIQRRPHDEKVQLNLTAQAQGTTIRPSSFPLPIRITDGALRWSPGSADFTGSVHVLGGHADLNCEVRGVRNGSGASVRLQAHAANLNPHSADRQVLRSFLGLPSGVEHLQWNSAGPWELELHQSPSAPTPNILLAGSLADSVLTWEPTDLLSTLQQGRFHFAQGPRHRTAVMTGVEGDVQGGYLASSLNMFGPHENPAGDFLGWSTGIPIGPEMVALAQQWVQEDGSKKSTHAPSTGIQFDGHIGFHMRAPIGSQQDETDGLSGTLTLAPLLMLEQGVLGSSAGRLEGDVEISPRGLSQGNFSFHSPGGDFQINDLHASRMESGLTAHGTLKSSKGVELTTRATQLLFPSAFEAFESLGLKGRLGCENLRLEWMSDSRKSSGELQVTGQAKLIDVQLDAAPSFANGSASLTVDSFSWQDSRHFSGTMAVNSGEVLVGGLALSQTSGQLSIQPDAVFFHDFEAGLLGGKVHTLGLNKGSTEPGIRIGLQPEAPIQIRVGVEGLDLSQVRRELNLPGALSGRVQGELDFSSTSPSPLDYSGVGSLTIEDGYLGTVPVLSALWESGGIQPPTFKSGKLLFKAHPKKHYGRIRLEEFDLHHDLLTVTGQGWLGMDGYLDLKATLRSGLVPIIGWGIPLISDLFFDPLVEQDVFGPLDRPIVRQRVLHKLTESNQKRIPLLLSFPILEREDWQRSPAWPPLISPSD